MRFFHLLFCYYCVVRTRMPARGGATILKVRYSFASEDFFLALHLLHTWRT